MRDIPTQTMTDFLHVVLPRSLYKHGKFSYRSISYLWTSTVLLGGIGDFRSCGEAVARIALIWISYVDKCEARVAPGRKRRSGYENIVSLSSEVRSLIESLLELCSVESARHAQGACVDPGDLFRGFSLEALVPKSMRCLCYARRTLSSLLIGNKKQTRKGGATLPSSHFAV